MPIHLKIPMIPLVPQLVPASIICIENLGFKSKKNDKRSIFNSGLILSDPTGFPGAWCVQEFKYTEISSSYGKMEGYHWLASHPTK